MEAPSDASVSTVLRLDSDCATTTEASSSGYAAGGSSWCEDEAVYLVSNDSESDQTGPSSKRAKVMTSDSRRKPTRKFKTSWKLPAYCKLCESDFNISHGGLNDIKRHVEGTKHQNKLKDISTNSTLMSFYGDQRRAREKCNFCWNNDGSVYCHA